MKALVISIGDEQEEGVGELIIKPGITFREFSDSLDELQTFQLPDKFFAGNQLYSWSNLNDHPARYLLWQELSRKGEVRK